MEHSGVCKTSSIPVAPTVHYSPPQSLKDSLQIRPPRASTNQRAAEAPERSNQSAREISAVSRPGADAPIACVELHLLSPRRRIINPGGLLMAGVPPG
ncbi:hypothetical protein NDU88_001792 [Pleurodeles waltl]|uniref:Uncharacterized protein n=1 Tax=Pleurodeles waltl TaxID=8319 RepID=A0AAV7LZ13_PLEWA|nr:hypothetical protein NDU88_001792 [Pleurodeles waltl]